MKRATNLRARSIYFSSQTIFALTYQNIKTALYFNAVTFFGYCLCLKCVFKPKGYNIVNPAMVDRQVVVEFCLLFRRVAPPPLFSQQSQRTLLRVHIYAFFPPTHPALLVRAIGSTSRGSSRLDALALFPNSLAILLRSFFSLQT